MRGIHHFDNTSDGNSWVSMGVNKMIGEKIGSVNTVFHRTGGD